MFNFPSPLGFNCIDFNWFSLISIDFSCFFCWDICLCQPPRATCHLPRTLGSPKEFWAIKRAPQGLWPSFILHVAAFFQSAFFFLIRCAQHLYKRLCLSICPSALLFVGSLFHWSIGLSVHQLKSAKVTMAHRWPTWPCFKGLRAPWGPFLAAAS